MDPIEKYDHDKIERKWQAEWLKAQPYAASDEQGKNKFYALVEFPFPSGDGLHVGHIRSYTALDIVARKRRMLGQNVLYPIGWDAFGLPTENYALKTGKDPKVVTRENSDNFRRQLQALGISFDWSREINTTDPEYYKWTQWLFLQFYKHGLAYKQKTLINWCPKDKIGLANEEVIDGKCERCGTAVEQKEKEQWLLAITKYADRLVSDLETVDYPERVKAQQRNWIGRSEGALIKFDDLEVFTTRPETIYGATYVAIAGKSDRDTGKKVKNPATGELVPVWEAEYVMEGVGTGAVMGVPAHDERDFAFATKNNLPIKRVVEPSLVQVGDSSAFRPDEPAEDSWGVIAIVKHWQEDKYLGLTWTKAPGWGTLLTGGIDEGMTAEETVLKEVREETGYKNVRIIKDLGVVHGKYYHVPKKANRLGHAPTFVVQIDNDEREALDAEESAKHQLHWLSASELARFLTPLSHQTALALHVNGVYAAAGVLTNSGEFNGLTTQEARVKMAKKFGALKTTYRLRDWIFSRQRYWGEPIPMIWCEACGWQPVPDDQLPVKLPEVKNYQPRDDGESPLASLGEWVNTTCPKCGGAARRETDVMPNWAGSSWYYIRYTDPKNDQQLASPESLKYWTPVDWYNGGMEHTTLHLLYSRFWHKFLFDLGVVPTSEPYAKRTSHGLILAEDGEKMSKSRGNVVNPDKIVELYGADTLRLYEMFMGPFEQAVAWSTESIIGPRRFIEKVWRLSEKVSKEGEKVNIDGHLKKISDDIERISFNTAVSELMIVGNKLSVAEAINTETWKKFLKVLYPFTPHIAAELWEKAGERGSLQAAPWPEFDLSQTASSTFVMILQVNGVVRDRLQVSATATEEEVKNMALQQAKIAALVGNKEIKKVIYVPQKLLNFVV